jgi:sialate O-acetylesterase
MRRGSQLLITRVVTLSLLAVATLVARADIRLPAMISDHAVLQRDRPIHLWGWAAPGAQLTAQFHNQHVLAQADTYGRWSLYLKPEMAGGPYILTLSGDGPQLTVKDLLVGDVWFASGQSNMEMPLAGFPPTAFVQNSEQEIAAASNPELRLLLVDHKSSDIPQSDVPGSWTTCTPETARHFSAVAYFFGRAIAAKEHVPIGLIDASWGGTPADSWVSLDELGSNPALLPAFASRAHFADQQTDVSGQIAAEKQEDDAAKAAGKPKPTHPWHPFAASWLPAGLYNGMIAPFTPMEIKGILWYQGETNSSPDRAPYYGTLFSSLIGDWRAHFSQGNLPFLFVQISSFTSPGEDWGLVRDEQRQTLAVANTAMTVTLDIGEADNVHPPDKQTVGSRMALAARAMVYDEAIAFQGPLFRQATVENQTLRPSAKETQPTAMRVWFDHGDGLRASGTSVTGFELAGEDHKFVPAEASIQGTTVRVQAGAIPHPRYVRYGWQSFVSGYLFNSAGLPASTFSSEQNPVH